MRHRSIPTTARGRAWRVAALLLLVGVLGARARTTSDLTTFGAFYSPAVGDYNSAQFKFTFLGGQEKRKTSLAGVSVGRPGGFALGAFAPFQHKGDYSNDSQMADTLVLTPNEIKAFMDNLLTQPVLQDTANAALPQVSIMLLRGSGPPLCWEHVTPDKVQGDSLFQMLWKAVANPADKGVVDEVRHHMVGVRQ